MAATPILHPRLASTLAPLLFPDRATVYGPDTNGLYTVPLQLELPCALVPLMPNPNGLSVGDRVELLARRLLRWDAAYWMPEHEVQVEVHGVRWNPVPGTFLRLAYGPGPGVFRRCDVARASGETVNATLRRGA